MKLETVEDDLAKLYSYLKSVNSSAPIPKVTPHGHNRVLDASVDKLRLVSQEMKDMDPRVVDGILDLYKEDFVSAGYGWDAEEGAFCRTNGFDCC